MHGEVLQSSAFPAALVDAIFPLTGKNNLPRLRKPAREFSSNSKGGSNMSRSFLRKSLVVVVGCVLIALGLGSANAASVGQELSNPQIRDANDNPATIPDFGTHVIALTYANKKAGDFGDPMNDAMKAKKYSKDVYRGMGVVNMKDSSGIPDFIIRKAVKSKIEKYKSTILTDPDLTLAKAWNLGNCKDKSVLIVVGKDKKIKYLRYTGDNNPWNKADIDAVLKILDELTAKK
jgi:predicted transcriptional regulator